MGFTQDPWPYAEDEELKFRSSLLWEKSGGEALHLTWLLW
jgi:hypothetical protein